MLLFALHVCLPSCLSIHVLQLRTAEQAFVQFDTVVFCYSNFNQNWTPLMSILYEELNMHLHAFQVDCFYMVIILLHTSISNEVL